MYRDILPESQREWPLLGLNLLRLLAKNKLDEFHIELEIIPFDKRSNFYIKHPVELEQCMMEGSYNKIMKGRDSVPLDTYKFFMNMLMNTVRYGEWANLKRKKELTHTAIFRDEIASCFEKAYNSLSVSEAQQELFLDANQFTAYAQQVIKAQLWKSLMLSQRNWRIVNGTVQFRAQEKPSVAEIPSLKLIQQTLQYARELERII